MPKAGLSHRIRLRDTSDANHVGLVLHKRDDGAFAYGWDLAPALAPDHLQPWDTLGTTHNGTPVDLLSDSIGGLDPDHG